jgi:signal transduction histidine kinase
MSDSAAPSTSGRFAPVAVLVLTVVVFAAVVVTVTLQLRAGVKEQILRREAGTLAAVASMQLDLGAAEYGAVELAEVPGALLVAVLKTAKLRGVAGVRVFDAKGALNSSDGIIGELPPPPPRDWQRLTAGEAFARVHARAPREDVFLLAETATVDGWVEAWVPLHRSGSTTMVGAAQFWLEGGAVRAEIGAHDERLWLQTAIAWAAGSWVIVMALVWAFRRLAAANRELRIRGEDLERANRELVLAAKTSALGTIAAHLMHELKNPIAGLEVFMAGQAEAGGGGRVDAGDEFAAASELTRRLRTMVNDVVGVLRDEQTGATFELTCADIVEIVRSKVQPEADRRGVVLEAAAEADVAVAGRRANLATLVLKNVIHNALEATPRGGIVRVNGGPTPGGGVEFRVEDGGPGLPVAVRERLFQPCLTTKAGGSGLGLALSQQLAQQANGNLELLRSDDRGTSFRLVLRAEA